MDVVTTDKSPTTIKSQTKNSIATETTTRHTTTKPVGGDGDGNGGPLDEEQDGDSSEGPGTVIIGAGAGGGVLLIILVIFIIIYVRRRRGGNGSGNDRLYDKPVEFKKTKKKKSLDVEEENYPPSSDMGEENKNTITAPSGDVYAKPVKKKHRTESEGGENKQNGLQTDTYANVQGITPDDNSNGVKITRFLFYVEEMKKNDNFGFKKEFEDLPVGQVHPWDVGRKAGNVQKNKYSNNAAYDHSRVILSGEEDYVNANFIKGVQSELYIAAQGPTDQTVNDFWRMIWEQDCTCIIALTNVVELGKVKCTQYWPDKEITFGDIHVKTVKTGLFADYVIRYLDLKKDGKGKTIVQYHFISWPDHGVPKYPTKLLAFRHRFRALHTVSTRPIVVHCSAGVGRTGTFIALDITLLRVNTLQENTINIHDAVKELRNERVNMVQTLEQYVFLHDAVLETVLCGFTETTAENLKTEIERLQQKELNKSISEFEVEFKKLASVTYPLAPDECKSALLQKNKSKNRVSNIYPTENFRVFICGTKEEEDPYINATYVHGYTHARAYIATQAPLLDTIDDFWKMVFEKKTVVVVMLNDTSEGKMTYPQYWPDEFNEEQQYGDLFVKMVSAETRGPIVSRKFVITNKSTKAAVAEHVVRHVQFTDWPEHGVPGNHSDVMDLLDSVEEAQQRSENGTVIVHCSDGAQRTGTYLTLAIQRERVRTEHVIDIFRCIKMMREQRPQFVGNLEQYKFCYYAMVTFIESFMTYDNIPKVQKK
ncbi:receptor-type tyrosine-protein phosphatase S-like [Dendronephthya gigantea]|uniref:receptor-type tyrosine-protein phosphatase S-like n=1 Tax=Dendronephthya gigantea TaxID=151771 RepID=UPI001069396C|nr:receptor-type tyrosine-protein phosphatase S-like [Dendronephthya gigantea]